MTGGKFLEGAPVFAAEVRSDCDYGTKAERAMADKRADYFAAGTLVVWDVDVLKDEIFGSIGRPIPLALQRIDAVSPLTRSRRSLGGACRWTELVRVVLSKRPLEPLVSLLFLHPWVSRLIFPLPPPPDPDGGSTEVPDPSDRGSTEVPAVCFSAMTKNIPFLVES